MGLVAWETAWLGLWHEARRVGNCAASELRRLHSGGNFGVSVRQRARDMGNCVASLPKRIGRAGNCGLGSRGGGSVAWATMRSARGKRPFRGELREARERCVRSMGNYAAGVWRSGFFVRATVRGARGMVVHRMGNCVVFTWKRFIVRATVW